MGATEVHPLPNEWKELKLNRVPTSEGIGFALRPEEPGLYEDFESIGSFPLAAYNCVGALTSQMAENAVHSIVVLIFGRFFGLSMSSSAVCPPWCQKTDLCFTSGR